jgi:hypothetical protein
METDTEIALCFPCVPDELVPILKTKLHVDQRMQERHIRLIFAEHSACEVYPWWRDIESGYNEHPQGGEDLDDST